MNTTHEYHNSASTIDLHVSQRHNQNIDDMAAVSDLNYQNLGKRKRRGCGVSFVELLARVLKYLPVTSTAAPTAILPRPSRLELGADW